LRLPSIVTDHEVGPREGSPYLVSDYAQGVTLADLLSYEPGNGNRWETTSLKVAGSLLSPEEFSLPPSTTTGPSGTCLAPLGGFSKPRPLAVVAYSMVGFWE
jgi:hypothetical protein